MSSDRHVQESVLDELRWEPRLEAGHIGVTVADGVVTLTGHVESYAQKHAAALAAHRVKGVKAVAQEIEVRLPVDDQRDDGEIAAAALTRLDWDVTIPRGTVHVTVEDGWITLSGTVDWHYQRENAEHDLQRLQGVTGITNAIAIKRTVDAEFISDDIMHALHRSWFFDPRTIDVRVEGSTVYLSGAAKTPHERQVAAATAWAAPGVTDVRNEIEVGVEV
ncbi:BON domain-containing protein (plasmid) [Sphingobium naphthae]|uniref:BON domain-containing protein n=1 Tax=Sphingobium naphthae TaxID=1886786 RepID=UPI000C978308|nr:ornithine aminotransferase [Erythrobacter sp.]MEA3388286.1 BON domain-containing protein [Pseudomonadota bacterium]|tara:strand:- start:2609 stop:3268 length:660 start_codon:yes stop_codon:yes gene_type:complete